MTNRPSPRPNPRPNPRSRRGYTNHGIIKAGEWGVVTTGAHRRRRMNFGMKMAHPFVLFGIFAGMIMLTFASFALTAASAGVFMKAGDPASDPTMTCTVTRVQHQDTGDDTYEYRVGTKECGELAVVDGIGGGFNSGDRASAMEIGKTYTVTTFGPDWGSFRPPFLTSATEATR